MFGSHVVLLALQKPGLRNFFTVLRPNTGLWSCYCTWLHFVFAAWYSGGVLTGFWGQLSLQKLGLMNVFTVLRPNTGQHE
jgi:hypothetical protein